MMITRRTLILTSLPVSMAASCGASAHSRLNKVTFATLEERLSGGRIGFHARNLGSGRKISHRADERFAMCSTFKWLLVAFVLKDEFNGQNHRSVPPIALSSDVLVPYAPVVEKALSEGREELPLEKLCEAAVSLSDNAAANLLLKRIGGPEGFTHRCRLLGDESTRLDRWEVALNENKTGDLRDTTTPKDMSDTLGKVLFTDCLLLAEDRERLMSWMIHSPTGKARLRAGFAAPWIVGDKTGTSVNGAVNDLAFATKTDALSTIVVASYINAPHASRAMAEGVHRDLGLMAATTLIA